MKIRNGFVSNSSSASFVIRKAGLTEAQIDAIKRHGEYSKIVDKHYREMAKELVAAGFDLEDLNYSLHEMIQEKVYSERSYFSYQDEWTVKETETNIIVGCICDNFDMYKFLQFIEVPPKLIESHDGVDLTWAISMKEKEGEQDIE